MFGFRRKNNDQQDTQIPYEVYESMQQPAAQRRRWITRLIVALLAATILVFGFYWLSKAFLNRDNGSTGSSQQQGGGNHTDEKLQPPEDLRQSPQQNPALTGGSGQPAGGAQSGSENNTTVRKPE